MIMIETATRQELENYILVERSLYAKFDEQRLLNGSYSIDDMRDVCMAWVEECPDTVMP